ncbi:Protein GrpE [Tepidimonas thermarum]|uniref:Protein GrpE n=1 Tax=Tepidimonas thermarum TaxID=335431 RepID=A0A554X5N5_9BURK|nr:nucleotide exchange factor GrpE [Tepidimonas thermarum]TSE31127.1 Protein GrpE [Tepidimonas thermarum]
MTQTDTPSTPTPNDDAHAAAATAGAADTAAAPDWQAELEALRQRNAELNDQLLRAVADAENTRRRAEEEMAKIRKFAVESFAESLLPVVDSLEAGLAVQEATLEQIRQGAQATLQQLLSALARHKVTPIAPAPGERFDPHLHQAISMVPSDQPANTIVATLQKGYWMAERVLRPALVTVAGPQ